MKNPNSKKLEHYRLRDRKKGLKCNITLSWWDDYSHKYCYYCGSTERIGCDRLDNTKGHTLDNVVPCCYRCNLIRSDYFTPEQMKKLAEFIKTL